jgi:phage/plasmid-like protein (TIGR03299 family)
MNAKSEPTFDLSNFHGVGNPIKGAATMDEALKQAGLDFTVSQHDFIIVGRDYQYDGHGEPVLDSQGRHIYTKTEIERDENDPKVLRLSQDSVYHGLTFPNLAPIVRDDTMEVISIMGSGYRIIQNKECVQTLADILQESKIEGHSLELFRGGAIKGCDFLYLAARLPHDMEVTDINGNVINIHKYLVIHWSHTGASKIVLSFVAYEPKHRAFLYNGQGYLDVAIRHTKNAKERLENAKKYLKEMYQSFSSFQRQLQELAGKSMDDKAYQKFIEEEVFPMPQNLDTNSPGGKSAETRIADKHGKLIKRFKEIEDKSACGAYVAVCKYYDNDTTVKQKKEGKAEKELKSENELRLFSSFKGTSVKGKNDAFLALNAM